MAIYIAPVRRKPRAQTTHSIFEILVPGFEVRLGNIYLQSFTGNSGIVPKPDGTESHHYIY